MGQNIFYHTNLQNLPDAGFEEKNSILNVSSFRPVETGVSTNIQHELILRYKTRGCVMKHPRLC